MKQRSFSEYAPCADASFAGRPSSPVFAASGGVIIFSEGITHDAFPVTDDSTRRSVYFNYMPGVVRNNLPDQRMSIYPDHVLERLSDQLDILSSPGYI